MTRQPDTKIPFRDIKDHADLMEAFDELVAFRVQTIVYGWDTKEDIEYLKSEIAHFLRIQSTQQGNVYDDENNNPMRNAGTEHKVKKNS